MSPLVETILFVFSLVALGYLCGVTRYLKPETGEGVAELRTAILFAATA